MPPKLYHRFFKDPKASYFLFGPRGTGKSTWVKKHYHNYHLVDLLDPATVRLFHAKPERLQALVYGEPEKKVITIQLSLVNAHILPILNEKLPQSAQVFIYIARFSLIFSPTLAKI